MKQEIMIAPSILSADFAAAGRDVKRVCESGADLIHCDVMDGIFVPNISFGPKFIKEIKPYASVPLDVHLMIGRPERYIDRFIDAGADYLTIHYEATERLEETLTEIRRAGVKPGLVISPDTDASVLVPYLGLVDMVLVMSVYPGFGGQKYIDAATDKLKFLRGAIDKSGYAVRLEVDGGITSENAGLVRQAGADTVVAGSAVFAAPDMAEMIKTLKGL